MIFDFKQSGLELVGAATSALSSHLRGDNLLGRSQFKRVSPYAEVALGDLKSKGFKTSTCGRVRRQIFWDFFFFFLILSLK